jgi:UDP-N-acetyl-D-mannosaminuronic acid dehydrogenase
LPLAHLIIEGSCMTTLQFRDVAVLGLGYIGLPTAAALAARGVLVIGVDVDQPRVDAINRGEVPFVEPDLAVAVSGAVAQGALRAQTEISHADAFIIAVPTPFKAGHEADLSHVRTAVESLAPALRGGELVVLESTSPPGTTRRVSQWLAELRPDLHFPHDDIRPPDVHVAHCPERVLPGRIMIEIVTNDRVIGGVSRACAERAEDLYRIFCQGDIALTDAESAEMSKLAENAYRDVNIAFANELSLIADQLHLDVWEVIAMANRHPRVNILTPGPGVGGHCIAVDPWFIVSAAPVEARLIRAAREINDAKPLHVVRQVAARARRMVEPTIAALGLAFKGNVDDLRESPAVEIVGRIADELPDVAVLAVEPHAKALPPGLAARDNVRLIGLAAALDQADIVLGLVDHTQFKSVKRSALEGKVVFDTRGIWR